MGSEFTSAAIAFLSSLGFAISKSLNLAQIPTVSRPAFYRKEALSKITVEYFPIEIEDADGGTHGVGYEILLFNLQGQAFGAWSLNDLAEVKEYLGEIKVKKGSNYFKI